MESLIALVNEFLSNEVALRRVLLILSAATLFILGLGISALVMSLTNPLRRRLGFAKEAPPVKDRLMVRVTTAIGPVAAYVLPQKESERTSMMEQLSRAGYRSPQAMQVFYATKSFLTVALPLLVLVGSRFIPELETRNAVIYAMFASGIGLLVPNFVLDRLVARRTKALRNGFPDALDLLVVCVESGLGLGAAIQRVADELEVSHPELAFELSIVNAEIRAGRPREQALRNLSDRTGLADIKGLVGLLVQTMRFGTGISDALRVYSEEFRDKRMQRAEEKAAKMGTTLLFPLVLCMFPVFFVVAIGPAVLRIMDWMGGR